MTGVFVVVAGKNTVARSACSLKSWLLPARPRLAFRTDVQPAIERGVRDARMSVGRVVMSTKSIATRFGHSISIVIGVDARVGEIPRAAARELRCCRDLNDLGSPAPRGSLRIDRGVPLSRNEP